MAECRANASIAESVDSALRQNDAVLVGQQDRQPPPIQLDGRLLEDIVSASHESRRTAHAFTQPECFGCVHRAESPQGSYSRPAFEHGMCLKVDLVQSVTLEPIPKIALGLVQDQHPSSDAHHSP
jgi:hypothetical protein